MHDLKQSWLNFAQQKKVKIAKGFVFLDQYVTKAQHPYIDVNCRILVKTEKVSYRLFRFRAETLERKGTSVIQICSKLHQHLLKETVESSRNLLKKKKRIKKSRHDQSSSKPVYRCEFAQNQKYLKVSPKFTKIVQRTFQKNQTPTYSKLLHCDSTKKVKHNTITFHSKLTTLGQ